MAVKPKLWVILGPTASGKSALALALAKRVSGEILSADSMQVYRGMDIGTAKPTLVERMQVPHHLVDLVEPDQAFTVARFVEAADAIIASAKVPLIVAGGTPLYYKALFEGLFGGPSADEEIRNRLRAISGDELHRRLAEVDPVSAQRIHANDTRRLVRALEVFELTGQPISSFQTEWTQPVARHEGQWIGLTWDKDAINRRINLRVKQMIEAGWLDEVRTLLAKYPTLSHTAFEATGYAELIAHMQGKMSLDEAIERIKIATRQLARRQMKWFRRFANVKWIPGDQPLDALIARTLSD